MSTVSRSNLMRLYFPIDLTGNLIMIEKLVLVGTWTGDLPIFSPTLKCQDQVIGFFFEILDLEKVRIDTEILSVLYIQPEIRKVIIKYIYDLGFEGQPSWSSNLFSFFWDPRFQECWNKHQNQLCIIITSSVTKGQLEGSLTSNFKVILQGHVNYFSIFGF